MTTAIGADTTTTATPARRAPRKPHPWLEPGVLLGALVPLAVLIARAARGTLGADPVAIALNQLGLLALVLLLATLAATPARHLLGVRWPQQIRRLLGLLAFFYACLHFCVYAVVDQQLALSTIVEDVSKRPFIMAGFSALLLLVPLAVNVQAPSRWGIPRSQSRSEPPRSRKAGTSRQSSGCTGPQW